MKASHIVIFAIAAAAFGRWTHNKPAASVQLVVQATFVVLIVAFMDQGETETVAKGLAWLFLAAVMLGKDSPITGVTAASFTKASPVKTAPVNPSRTV